MGQDVTINLGRETASSSMQISSSNSLLVRMCCSLDENSMSWGPVESGVDRHLEVSVVDCNCVVVRGVAYTVWEIIC